MKKLILILACLALACGADARMGAVGMGGGVAAVAAAAPEYGGEIQRWKETASASTTVITLTSGIAQGKTVVAFANVQSPDTTLASVEDSRGNTYALGEHHDDATTAMAYAYVATALQTNDTVTITWAAPSYQYRHGAIFYLNNVASSSQTDGHANGTSYGTAISISADTTATNTVCIGALSVITTATYGSSSWTVIGSAHDNDGVQRIYYFYKTNTSSGTQNPGGALSDNLTWYGIWNSFK